LISNVDDRRTGVAGPVGDPASPYRGDPDQVSVLAWANALLRHRWLLLVLPLLAAVVAVAVTLLRDPQYTASSHFIVESSQGQRTPYAGFAAQFGINLNSQGAIESPQFYGVLVETRGFLREVAASRFRVAEAGDTATVSLAEALGLEAATPEQRVQSAAQRLTTMTDSEIDPTTGMVTLRVTAPSRELAVQINQRMLDLVNRFNVEKRQSRASAERTFVGDRVEEARNGLVQAEESLASFLERNRSYRNSPQLQFEVARLEREVSLRQQVYTGLVQLFEQARIDEVRNTPAVNVIESPQHVVFPSGRGPLANGLLAFFAAAVAALLLALLLEFLSRQLEQNPRDYAQFRELTRSVLPGVSRRSRS
jgi:uncharacterized protein involved in exopolysaccharide biosynthesis